MTLEEKAREYAFEVSPYEPYPAILFYKAYLAGATEVLALQWKDPKEELPEDGEWVIILAGEDGVQTAVWNRTHQCWDDDEGDDVKYEKDVVTLWMPIPEPPVKGGDL